MADHTREEFPADQVRVDVALQDMGLKAPGRTPSVRRTEPQQISDADARQLL